MDLDEQQRADELLALLKELAGTPCHRCQNTLCGHELTMSVAMGFKNAPVCLACLAHHLERPKRELREDLHYRVVHRDCFLQGWRQASRDEGFANQLKPPCLWPDGAATAKEARDEAPTEAVTEPASASWDAGDMSCGDLVLELRGRLNELAAGALFKLRATDSAAPEDIPAWCRVTRNPLIQSDHPIYWIRRKER